MATRFKLGNSGTAPCSPSVGSSWENTVPSFARFPAYTVNQGGALADVTELFIGTVTGQTCWRQWVSRPLDSDQTISGTASIVLRGKENNGADNLFLAFGIRVMIGDTSTTRGAVLFNGTNTGGSEYSTANQTRIWNAVAVNTVNALKGDRIVIEAGMHGQSPGAGAQGTLRFGDPIGTADFALTTGLATDLVSWLELSTTLTFSQELVPLSDGDGEVLAVPSAKGAMVPLGDGGSEALAAGSKLAAAPALGEGGSEAAAAASAKGAIVGLAEGSCEVLGVTQPQGQLVAIAEGGSEALGVPSAKGALVPLGDGGSEALAAGSKLAAALAIADGGSEATAAPSSLVATAGLAEGGSESLTTSMPPPAAGMAEGSSDALALPSALAGAPGLADGDSDAAAGDPQIPVNPNVIGLAEGSSDCMAASSALSAGAGLAEGQCEQGYFALAALRMVRSKARRTLIVRTTADIGSHRAVTRQSLSLKSPQ